MKKELKLAFDPRQYMLSKDFEAFFYSDTTPKSINQHSHNYYEFYLILSGDVSINIEGQTTPLAPCDVIILPPHTTHRMEIGDTTVPYERFVFWITEEYYNKLVEIANEYSYLKNHVANKNKYIYHYDIFTFNSLQTKLTNLLEEVHFNRFGKDAKVQICLQDFLFHLNRTIYEMEHPQTPKENLTLYQNVIQYIENHLEEDLTLDMLANELFVSKYHIAHVFKENIGLSIHQFITKKRLSLCRDAILSGTDISEAYLKCGFKDYSSFFRAFKKEYGISPREYRDVNKY